MKAMIVVTHLLGSGHLSRALVLARAFEAAGHEVVLVSGGMPAPQLDTSGLTLEQLAPLRSDGVNFTRLLDESGSLASPTLLGARQDLLLRRLRSEAPDVLITELFPFGRRVLAAEFTALLRAAQRLEPRPLVFASLRDILAPPSKPAKAHVTQALVAEFYDGVLVHADPDLTPLEASWPVTDALAAKLRYTGFVAPPAAGAHPQAAGSGEVIVSAGGGNVGLPLFEAALAAARQDPAHPWRLLVGGSEAARIVAELAAQAPPNVIVEPARKDFRQMLHHAAASVSMCGYNTALDVLQAGTPAVFVPFDAGNEREQGLRAAALAKRDGIEVLQATEVTAERLLERVRRAVAAPRRAATGLGVDGAAEAVRIVDDMRKAMA